MGFSLGKFPTQVGLCSWIVNTLKGVIKSRELPLALLEEIRAASAKQRVTDDKRIKIRKGRETILMNTYILTFNQFKIPKELKIG